MHIILDVSQPHPLSSLFPRINSRPKKLNNSKERKKINSEFYLPEQILSARVNNSRFNVLVEKKTGNNAQSNVAKNMNPISYINKYRWKRCV